MVHDVIHPLSPRILHLVKPKCNIVKTRMCQPFCLNEHRKRANIFRASINLGKLNSTWNWSIILATMALDNLLRGQWSHMELNKFMPR